MRTRNNTPVLGLFVASLALTVLGPISVAHARTETLRWISQEPTPDGITGYRVHHGLTSGSYDTTIDVGLPAPDGAGVYSYNLVVPDTATVYVVLTAYKSSLESVPSNERILAPPSNQAPDGTIAAPSGPVTITAGQPVSFSGTGTDPDGDLPLAYLWDFGNSGVSPSASQDPGTVTFSTAGTFVVSFSVTDSQGLTDPTPATRVVTVQVSNQAPNGIIDGPSGSVTIAEGQSVSFSGTGTDPDGDLPLAYSWDFGTSGVSPSTSEDPGAVAFATAGTFVVSFSVTDSRGLTDSTPATRVVTVQRSNQAPNGTIDAPAGAVTIDEGQSLSFLGSGTDPDGDLPLAFQWDFGNSGVPPVTSRIPGSVPFATAGTYVVRFTVADSKGLADPTPATVVVTVLGADTGLLAHWRFDDGTGPIAFDDTGNGYAGTLVGPAWRVETPWQAETPDGSVSALHFDGLDDYVDLGGLDAEGDALTLAMWFQANSFSSPWRDDRLLSKATSTAEQGHYWMLSTIAAGAETRLRFRLKTNGSTTTLIASSGDVPVGTWVHAAAVYDGSSMRLYLDGVEVGNAAKSGFPDRAPSVAAAIGNQPPGAGAKPFHGAIDDVRVYTRALGPAEILDLLASSPPPPEPPPNGVISPPGLPPVFVP